MGLAYAGHKSPFTSSGKCLPTSSFLSRTWLSTKTGISFQRNSALKKIHFLATDTEGKQLIPALEFISYSSSYLIFFSAKHKKTQNPDDLILMKYCTTILIVFPLVLAFESKAIFFLELLWKSIKVKRCGLLAAGRCREIDDRYVLTFQIIEKYPSEVILSLQQTRALNIACPCLAARESSSSICWQQRGCNHEEWILTVPGTSSFCCLSISLKLSSSN